MRNTTLTVVGLALALGVAGSALAQTVVAPDYPVGNSEFTVVPAPQPAPDPAAAARCQMVSQANYWDCVNSYHGGG